MGKLFEELMQAKLAEQSSSNIFEIEKEKLDGQVPHKYWTKGVMYKGMNVYHTVYEDSKLEADIIASIKRESGLPITSDQESFLAYNFEADTFIMGFDIWWEDEDDGNDDEDDFGSSGMAAGYGVFKILDNGTKKILSAGTYSGNKGFYPHGMKRAIASGFKTLIRLD